MPPKANPSGNRKKSVTSRKKRRLLSVLKSIGIILLVLLPLALALGSYSYKKSKNAAAEKPAFVAVALEGPSGARLTANDGEDKASEESAIVSSFARMIEGKTAIGEIPATHSAKYRAQMTMNNGEAEEYAFFFSSTSPIAYLRDAAGHVWQAPEDAAAVFLNSAYSFELYPQSQLPILTTAATDVIVPETADWHYKTQRGTFAALRNANVTDKILEYPIANDVAFYFSVTPSDYEIVIRHNGEEVHRGAGDNISLSLHQNEVLGVTITATFDPPDADFYGSLTYRFSMRVEEAASFSLNTNTTRAGGFFLLTCRNVRNEQNLTLSATPALSDAPVIFKRGDLVFAAIPARDAGERDLRVTYGTVRRDLHLSVTASSAADLVFPAGKLRGDLTDMTGGALEALASTYGSTQDDPLLLPQFAAPSGEKVIGFQDTVSGKNAGAVGTAEFELYRTSGAVPALGAGVVKKIGVDDLLGKFVVVDHGCGLCTWYGGLFKIRVREGDPVAKGETIGLAGQTGFGLAGADSVTILATLGRALISPTCLQEQTFRLSD